MTTSFYDEDELRQLGLAAIGHGCKISRKASFYDTSHIHIGDNVRIDDFCILSGNITLGNNIHISAYVALYGAMGITLEDYTGVSPRSTIYSAMDDFGGDCLVGPIHKAGTTRVGGGPVTVRRYAHIACNTVIFPNVEIGEGTVVGACSMVRHSLGSWGIYYGNPIQKRKDRLRTMIRFADLGGGKPLYFSRLALFSQLKAS